MRIDTPTGLPVSPETLFRASTDAKPRSFHQLIVGALLFVFLVTSCTPETEPLKVEKWTTHEVVMEAAKDYANPYTEVDTWAVFRNSQGDSIIRPGFWDGGNIWRIRFTPPDDGSIWSWKTFASTNDQGLSDQSGELQSIPYSGSNDLLRHGLLKMSAGRRTVVHADGTTFLVVGDTPWALPFRATWEQAKIYALDRQAKGFNAALLMTVQPDMNAEGPDARDTSQGFTRGFQDLSDGHINQLRPDYFQYLDSLIDILIGHEIVPVYQPVFHGFGWKGLDVLGNHIESDEYVRYSKYLLARYGSKPAFWLLAGDNGGDDPGVKEAGEMMEQWDGYGQPTGLHYNPCDDYVADWAKNNPLKHCEHYNMSHQGEGWLDFQWAQTGHNGEHLYHKVERMYDNQPIKASANGEPTYEGMNNGENGLGWWQGEEAWMQLMSGGTMGVVYGAAGLWQWKVTSDEEGWTAWAGQPKSWKEAMEMEGSRYVGYVSRILGDLPMADISKRSDLTSGDQPLLAKEGELYVSYLNAGGEINIQGIPEGLAVQWHNPVNGESQEGGVTGSAGLVAPSEDPWVLVIRK